MRYRVLGPLEVTTESGEARLPKGGKQRLLLAALLRYAPRVAAVDRLTAILWGEDPPEDPIGALHTQISRLRTFLGETGPGEDPLQSEPYGYRLAVQPENVDAGRFQTILQRVRDAPTPHEALSLLEQALALWRGDPFEEFTDVMEFAGEITRLRELFSGAREHRVECLLLLGRASDALAVIEPLIHEDPLRERPRALLMKALYQAGRQHEALSAFQDYRRLLSEELGLDPSPALRQLEGEILRHERPVVPIRAAAMARPETPDPPTTQDAPWREDATLDPEAGTERPGPESNNRLPPASLARLIGREHELRSIHRLLRSTRLLTLTGAGGSGKTRLALEIARQVRLDAAREVIWVALDAIFDPALIPYEIAAAIGIGEQLERSPADALLQVLRARDLLLVLDNCEHLIEACASLAETLLRGCPGLTVLATSREPLGIMGEVTRPVPPLSIPDEEDKDPVALDRFAAVQLFVERARAAAPAFELRTANAVPVAQICRRLDGIPLALELAAARIRTLATEQIAERLDQRFALLTVGSRTAVPRHQTLRAAIDWSYELLTEPERRMLERLSIFAGSFGLPAVEAVCAPDSSPTDVLDQVSALVDKSLVVTRSEDVPRRYRLLETVRHYAHERLLERGAEEDARRRHAEYFASLAEGAGPFLLGPYRAKWARRLAAEQDNIRAALTWSLGPDGDGTYALRIAGSLWWFWHYIGQLTEGRRWVERAAALSVAGESLHLRARLLYGAAKSNWILGDSNAGMPYADEGVSLCRRLGDDRLLIYACVARALVRRDYGDLVAALRSAEECVEVTERSHAAQGDIALAFYTRGVVHFAAQDFPRASADLCEAVHLWRASGDKWGLSEGLHCRALCELERGDIDHALSLCREAVTTLRDEGEIWFLCRCLEALATILSRKGEPYPAACLLGATEALRESIRAPVLGFDRPRYELAVEGVQAALGAPTFAVAWSEGRKLNFDQTIEYALHSCGSAAAAADHLHPRQTPVPGS